MWKWFRWVLLGIGIIIVLFGIVFFVFIRPTARESANISIPPYKDPKCSRVFTPEFNVGQYYQGALFDSHFHIPPEHGSGFGRFGVILEKDLTLSDIVCELEKEKILGTASFYAPNAWLMVSLTPEDTIINQWTDQMKEIHQGMPEWMHLFYDPISEYDNEAGKVYGSAGNIIDGFGEMTYLQGDTARPGAKVDDAISQEIFGLAGKNKKIVMIHPEQKNKQQVENMLKQYPDTNFIVHGWGHDDYVVQLMDNNPNFYFTLDATTFSQKAPRYIQGPKEKYIKALRDNFSTDLESAVNQWKKQIKRHPDRFFWGTDKCFDFHYSEEVSKLYEEFARAFIGRLDPQYQDYVAFRNAQRLFSADKSDMPPMPKGQTKLNNLKEDVRLCIIGQIGESEWREISTGERPATPEEEQVISQCSK